MAPRINSVRAHSEPEKNTIMLSTGLSVAGAIVGSVSGAFNSASAALDSAANDVNTFIHNLS